MHCVSLKIGNTCARALFCFSPGSEVGAWFRSQSSNPRSCISKSSAVSEVILQPLSTSHHAMLRLGWARATTLQCSAELFISHPHWGSDPRQPHQHQLSLSGSRRRQSLLTSHTTLPHGATQPGATSSQCSVGQFLPFATQQ